MEMVFESHNEIRISENNIKQLHQVLLKYSSKDARHRGEYKKFPNHVEAIDSNGESLGIIFETASPFETPSKISGLVAWFEEVVHVGKAVPETVNLGVDQAAGEGNSRVLVCHLQ